MRYLNVQFSPNSLCPPQGTNPTALKVREILTRGSPNTIQPWLVAWREARKPPQKPIPDDLAAEALRRGGEALGGLLQAFWPRLSESLEADFRDRLTRADHQAQELAAELDSALQGISRTDEQLEELRAERDALSHQVATLTAAAAGTQQLVSDLSSAALTATATADRHAQDLARLQELHQLHTAESDRQLADLRTTLHATLDDIAKVRAVAAVQEKMEAELRERLQSEQLHHQQEMRTWDQQVLDFKGRMLAASEEVRDLEVSLRDERAARAQVDGRIAEQLRLIMHLSRQLDQLTAAVGRISTPVGGAWGDELIALGDNEQKLTLIKRILDQSIPMLEDHHVVREVHGHSIRHIMVRSFSMAEDGMVTALFDFDIQKGRLESHQPQIFKASGSAIINRHGHLIEYRGITMSTAPQSPLAL